MRQGFLTILSKNIVKDLLNRGTEKSMSCPAAFNWPNMKTCRQFNNKNSFIKII